MGIFSKPLVHLTIFFVSFSQSWCSTRARISKISLLKLLIVLAILNVGLGLRVFYGSLNKSTIQLNRDIPDKTSKNVPRTGSSETKDELEINQEDLIPEMINLTLADENEKLPNLIRDMKNLTLVDENEKFRISQEEPSCIFEPNVKNANMGHCKGTTVGKECDVKCHQDHEWNHKPVKCVDNKNSQPEWDENGAECIENVYCRNNNSEKVDWYVAYRLPTNPRTNGKKRTGEQRLPNRFLFITPDGIERHFTSDAVENTVELLTNVHERPFIKYAVYNDQPPPHSNRKYGSVSNSKGHVKGMLVYNTLHKGFFTQHTQPKFPPVQGFELKEASEYGQTYVCVTVSSSKNIRRIIRHISQLRPEIYATNIKQEIPAPIENLPWNLLRISIHSENEQPFKLFSKTKRDVDIYNEIADKYDKNIYVQSWRHGGRTLSNGGKTVKIVKKMQSEYIVFEGGNARMRVGSWTDTQDHSKWLVSKAENDTLFCAGDLNRDRMLRRTVPRFGGAICLNHVNTANLFWEIITEIE